MGNRSNRLVLGVALALAGCGGGDSGPGAATTSGTTTGAEAIEFTGYLVGTDGETRICEALAESYPPQCGVHSYRVVGLDVRAVEGTEEASGVSWTQHRVTLRGVVADDGETLVVHPDPSRGRAIPPPTAGNQPGSAGG
jgi:hypothetical protein